MKITLSSASLALSCAPLLASCTPITKAPATPQTTAVPARRNIVGINTHQVRMVTGPIMMNETVVKLGRRAPRHIERAAEKHARAIEHNELVKRGLKMNINPVPSFLDTEYLVPAQVGNQKMNVEVDTGSTQNWFFSTQLEDPNEGKGHVLYNPGSKQPIKDADGYSRSFYHNEDDESGYSFGIPYADKVILGTFTATSAHVGAATVVSDSVRRKKSDGSIAMGLDYPYCKGFCNSFLQSKPFTPGNYLQKFAVDLKQASGSTWEFGSWAESTYPFAKQSWANVIKSTPEYPLRNLEGRWMIASGACRINGVKDSKTQCNHNVVISTSSPMIMLPQPIVDYYYSKVKGATYDSEDWTWYVPCSSTLPSFGVTIDPINHPEGNTTPGNYLNLGALNDGTGRCYPAIQHHPYQDLDENILGTSFLKSQYVAFEAYLEKGVPDGGAVMFAPKALTKGKNNGKGN